MLKIKYNQGEIESANSIDPKTDPNTVAALLKYFF